MIAISVTCVYLVSILATAQGQACSCFGGCNTSTLYFPDSNGRIVDVAFGKEADMSSRYSGGEGTSGPACVAVNGKTSTVFRTLKTSNPSCVHTAVGDHPNAWWKVDLGRNYTVTNVTIYRRRNAQRRMSGIHVEVDNQPCYSFPLMANNATALDVLPEKIEVTCVQPLTGRVVRLQKRGQGENYQYGAQIISVCEVQVWGCADAYVEPDCKCGHCRSGVRCDDTTLDCPSGRCDRGWTSRYCNQSCPVGMYGYDCGARCGQCAGSDTCNTLTGLCPHGCQSGWQGDNCKQECMDRYYGVGCTSRCGNCSDGDPCNKVNGTCPSGCQPGFHPSDHLCKTCCTGSTYGSECAYQCGQCANNAPCDVVTGHCQACQPNLTSPLCQVCEGTLYGAQCDRQCSAQCGGDGSCHRNNGSCLAGCVSGYLLGQSGFCDTKCPPGSYGSGCSRQCGLCANFSTCRHDTGLCQLGCAEGFGGKYCVAVMAKEVSSNLAGPIAGAIFGGLVVIAVCIIVVVLILRRSKARATEQAHPVPESAYECVTPEASAESGDQVTSREEDTSLDVTEYARSDYDTLQTPDDSDRAPYSRPVFARGKQDSAPNSHVYTNPGLHATESETNYYNL